MSVRVRVALGVGVAAALVWIVATVGPGSRPARAVDADATAGARSAEAPPSPMPWPALTASEPGSVNPASEQAARVAPDAAPVRRPPPMPSELRQLVRASLARALVEVEPAVDLTGDELDDATDAVLRVRRARLALRSLPRERGSGDAIRRWRRRLGEASAEFEAIAGVELDEVTEADTPGGVTEDDSEESDEPILETMREAKADAEARERVGRGGRGPRPRGLLDAGA